MIFILMLQETSAFNACFALARGLEEAGETVAFITGSAFQDYVGAHGFKTLHCEPSQPLPDSPKPSQAAEDKELRGLADLTAQHQPKLLLLDQIMWYKAPPFLEAHVPIIGLNTTLAGAFHWKTPPIFSSRALSPTPGPTALAANTLAWARLWIRKLPTAYNKSVWMLLERVHGRRIWLTRRQAVRKSGGSMGWFEYGFRLQIPELVLGPRLFDEPCARFKNRVYAGACVDDARLDGLNPWSGEDAAGLEADSRPLVYASLGSYGHYHPKRLRFFNTLIRIFRDRPHLRLVIQLKDGPQALETCPENVMVKSWLPQLSMLHQARLFLTHAGFGSCREALWCGTPMIAFPFYNDQFGNTTRILHHGLGQTANLETGTASTLGPQIDQMLSDPRYQQRMMAFQEKLRKEGISQKGVTFILKWLEDKSSTVNTH